jgi:hypothetical protein
MSRPIKVTPFTPDGAPTCHHVFTLAVSDPTPHPVTILQPQVPEAVWVMPGIPADFDMKAFRNPPSDFNDDLFSDRDNCFEG